MELTHTTLGDRIKNIRLILQRPYHIFGYLPDGNIMLVLENDEGQRLSFRGDTIAGSVKTAEDYIKHETKAGALKPKEETEEEKPEEEPEEKKEEKEETEKKE